MLVIAFNFIKANLKSIFVQNLITFPLDMNVFIFTNYRCLKFNDHENFKWMFHFSACPTGRAGLEATLLELGCEMTSPQLETYRVTYYIPLLFVLFSNNSIGFEHDFQLGPFQNRGPFLNRGP